MIADLDQEMTGVLDTLNDRERQIINLRFGLTCDKPKTLQATGDELGIQRERVRQLQNIALSKMRRRLRQAESGISEIVKEVPALLATFKPSKKLSEGQLRSEINHARELLSRFSKLSSTLPKKNDLGAIVADRWTIFHPLKGYVDITKICGRRWSHGFTSVAEHIGVWKTKEDACRVLSDNQIDGARVVRVVSIYAVTE